MNAVTVRRLFTVALLAYGLYDLSHLGRGTLLGGVGMDKRVARNREE